MIGHKIQQNLFNILLALLRLLNVLNWLHEKYLVKFLMISMTMVFYIK